MKNYHTHTYRCRHALGLDEDYVLAAIKGGITELGFSDHTPWPYINYESNMRMKEIELDSYINSIKELRNKYKDKISIKIGLEVEYFKKYMPWLQLIIKQKDIDFLILGQHFDQSEENTYFGARINYDQLNVYVDTVIEAIDSGLFSYIAHPDLGHFDNSDRRYINAYTRLCKHALKADIPLEFNLLGFKEGRHYPNESFWKIASNVGNKVIIGVDAHEPSRLYDITTYNKAIKYLNDLGLEIVEDIKFLR